MNEFNILIICITLLIIVFFIYLLFKDKKAGGEIEFDTKKGKVKLKKIINSNAEKEKSINELKNNSYEDDRISQLKIYKEFVIILNVAQNSIIKDISIFLRHNNITDMDISQYNVYIQNKIILISSTYNNEFAKSKNPFINIITIENLLGKLRPIIRQNIKDFFNSVYDTHKVLNDKRLDYIKQIRKDTDDKGNLLSELYKLMYKDLNDCLDKDTATLYLMMNEIDSVLISLFHDLLLEYIKDN